MTLEFEYRQAAGWIAKATLEGSDSYGIENFPVQATYQISRYLYPWLCIDQDLSTYPERRRSSRAGGLYEIEDGDLFFVQTFKIFTPDMIDYWEATFPTNTPVTVKARKKPSAFGVYQAYILNPRRNAYKRIDGNALDYKVEYYLATELV